MWPYDPSVLLQDHRWLALALMLLGCDALQEASTTRFHEVAVRGLPSCERGPGLRRPIRIELHDGDTRLQQTFTGFAETTARPLSVPEGERAWQARFGLCDPRDPDQPSYACRHVTWFAERALELDSADPGVTIDVPPAPETECLPAAR